jgi:tetraprenyl-beta-curcumene synthase
LPSSTIAGAASVAAEKGVSGAGRLLASRATLALALASARYWSTVAPVVRVELERWRARALAIPDPELRELALAKLDAERFNAEAGAMLATLAPRSHRADAAVAIVALEVLFDLLDGLTERPLEDPIGDGQRLFAPFVEALHAMPASGARASLDSGDYLSELSQAAGAALARIPAWGVLVDRAAAAAERAAQAQIHMHAVERLGIGQLERWAREQPDGAGLGWRELLAGSASSVLAVHALIVAATDARVTAAQAARIDHAYLSICALLTLLDSLIDQRQDEREQRLGYIALYEDRELLAQTLPGLAARAAGQARELPRGAHHAMVLAGVVAYYSSAPEARGEHARAAIRRLRRSLGPLVLPPLWLMQAWRLARRLRDRT